MLSQVSEYSELMRDIRILIFVVDELQIPFLKHYRQIFLEHLDGLLNDRSTSYSLNDSF
jgi:hypothetical protein